MRAYWQGLTSYLRGLAFSFSDPKTRKIIFGSMLIYLVFFGGLFVFGAVKVAHWIQGRWGMPATWFQYLTFSLAYMTALAILAFGVAIVVYFISNLILIQLGRMLSCHVLVRLGVDIREAKSVPVAVVLKALAITSLVVITFFISLIPGLGIIGLFLSSLVLTFDMMDYGFDHVGLTIPERLSFFKRNPGQILGFATGLMIIMTLPVINVLLLPNGIVAASFLLARMIGRK